MIKRGLAEYAQAFFYVKLHFCHNFAIIFFILDSLCFLVSFFIDCIEVFAIVGIAAMFNIFAIDSNAHVGIAMAITLAIHKGFSPQWHNFKWL